MLLNRQKHLALFFMFAIQSSDFLKGVTVFSYQGRSRERHQQWRRLCSRGRREPEWPPLLLPAGSSSSVPLSALSSSCAWSSSFLWLAVEPLWKRWWGEPQPIWSTGIWVKENNIQNYFLHLYTSEALSIYKKNPSQSLYPNLQPGVSDTSSMAMSDCALCPTEASSTSRNTSLRTELLKTTFKALFEDEMLEDCIREN